jgi:DNA-binding transcriptional MerR regulator
MPQKPQEIPKETARRPYIELRTENFSVQEKSDTARFTGVVGWTISDLAAILQSIAPNKAYFTEQLRHWTKMGALAPIAATAHAGGGNHRRYDNDAVYKAAFLHTCTLLGLPVANNRFLKAIRPQIDAAAAQWEAARQKQRTVKLEPVVLAMLADGTIRINAPASATRDAVATLAFDLNKLFAGVDRGRT